MRRTEQLQGLRLMKFEEVYGRSFRGELSQLEAPTINLLECWISSHSLSVRGARNKGTERTSPRRLLPRPESGEQRRDEEHRKT